MMLTKIERAMIAAAAICCIAASVSVTVVSWRLGPPPMRDPPAPAPDISQEANPNITVHNNLDPASRSNRGWLTLDEVAAAEDVDPTTVGNWIQAGEFKDAAGDPAAEKVNGRWRIKPDYVPPR